MKNLNNINYTESTVKKIAYVIFIGILSEILVAGKRIALMGELKSIKMLVNPDSVDIEEDLALLKILEDPHVKLASDLAWNIHDNVIVPYIIITGWDDVTVGEDKQTVELAWKIYWRFMFSRVRHRRRDRYINFNKVLRSGQRLIYELLKLWVTGKTNYDDCKYRSNYSPGRVKSLLKDNKDPLLPMLDDLINELRQCEVKSQIILANK